MRDDLPTPLLVALVTAAAEAADRWLVEAWEDLDPAELESASRGVFAALRRLAEPGPATRKRPR